MENYVDKNLWKQAENGNREAIREMTKLAAEHLQDMATKCVTGNDTLTLFLLQACEAIAAGDSPDTAFGWNKRNCRQPSNNDFYDWSIALNVRGLINSHDMVPKAAVSIVMEASGLSKRKVETAYKRWGDTDMPPETIYLINKESAFKLKKVEENIDTIVQGMK